MFNCVEGSGDRWSNPSQLVRRDFAPLGKRTAMPYMCGWAGRAWRGLAKPEPALGDQSAQPSDHSKWRGSSAG
jgi:hypothetical protein